MFVLDTPSTSASRANFSSFTDAANCAVRHAMQRKEDVQIRYATSGLLLADLSPQTDGTIAIVGVCEGRGMILEWVG